MEFDQNIDLSKRKFTSRLIVERALARGWHVIGFKTNPAVFQLLIPGKDKPVNIFSASPSQMSYPATKIAKDKFITNSILARANMPVPAEILVDVAEPVDEEALTNLLTKYKKLVVKPLDASHGKGITVNISDIPSLRRAVSDAKTESTKSTVLVQEQVAGVDIRIVCIDYKFVDSISRLPAQVAGDGIKNVRELIKTANQHPDRGENYKARLNYIPLDKASDYLGSAKLVSIPQKGEIVQVIGVSNIGMGGERQNIKHDIPTFLKKLAEEAAKTLELPICGVDFMVRRLPKATDTIEDLQPKVIEVNECPMLTMYDDLNSPEQYEVIDRYLNFVADI